MLNATSFKLNTGYIPYIPNMVTGGNNSPEAKLTAFLGAYASRASFRVVATNDPTILLVRCKSVRLARRLYDASMKGDVTPVEQQHGILIRSICDAGSLARGSKDQVQYFSRSGPKHTAMRNQAERWLKVNGYTFEHNRRNGMFRRYGLPLTSATMLKVAFAPELALVTWDRPGVPW